MHAWHISSQELNEGEVTTLTFSQWLTNQLITESKWTVVPNLKEFLQSVLHMLKEQDEPEVSVTFTFEKMPPGIIMQHFTWGAKNQ